MSPPLPFTAENVRAVWMPRLKGWAIGASIALALSSLAYLIAGVWA